MTRKNQLLFGIVLMLFMLPQPIYAMHIMEGYLPPVWCLVWGSISIPFVVLGFFSIKKRVENNPKLLLLLAMAGAYAFVLSALKLPSITGSTSHPTGVGLGAILFGPTVMSVIGLIILFFQAILLAHGGLTTLGANTFSMAVVGPFVSYSIFKGVQKLKGSLMVAVFLAAMFGDLFTYVTTAVQLAMAWPDPLGGFQAALVKYLGIFAITQLPIAISEGILTVIIFKAISAYNQDSLIDLNVFTKEVKSLETIASKSKG
ncbi:MAG: energy-coupling factor ABC transporter permease [Vallitaleaceae bacterium]|nr:energy-coupling factor ABC transporter permease [Vallitaleaceae bacterium]